jgi:nitrate/TMAO reductase-like tetraheme cytochrome c subunit
MLRFLRGGDRVTGGTLSRFYGWHVAILPAITCTLLGAHLLLVQLKGMSVPPVIEREPQRKPMKFFPHFALRDLSGWILALGVIAALAALFPWELGEKADPFAPAYENIRPEWYYVFMFQTLKLVPGGEIFHVEYEAIPILLFGLAGGVLAAVPFLDRNVVKKGRSPLFDAAGIIGLIFVIGMTCYGYMSLLPLWIMLITAVLLLFLAFVTRQGKKSGDSGGSGKIRSVIVPTSIIVMLLVAVMANAAPQTSCTICHNSDMFDAAAKAQFKHMADDIHVKAGLSCESCHGGNPDPKLADDMGAAMDPAFKANPFVGKPDRIKTPDFCGKCHASADFMKRFNPAARIDVLAEYRSSLHGQQLAKGDPNVATCTDCHGVHGILAKDNPSSGVYATNVAQTCSRCHSDPKRMSAYKTAHGAPMPVDQYARWQRSVHANAMLNKGDLSAPTCNDCHGNHGAMPPGVNSITYICGSCHAREAELFQKTAKHEGFVQHNELLASGSKCSDCHEGVNPAVVASTHQFSDCITCHENHAVTRPTVALLGGLPETPCAFCHEGNGPMVDPEAEPKAKREHYRQLRDTLLAAAARQNLAGDARFDWLVDQSEHLPTHILSAAPGKTVLRPEFARLYEKFRIGKTHYTYTDPATGQPVKVAVRKCGDCHVGADSVGAKTGREMLTAMQQLTATTARAERTLLAAKRGGVEVRTADSELDDAVDSQIELEVLVHSASSSGAFADKQKEGMKHASAALTAGKQSLAELTYRRNGLGAALGVIMLVLTGLAFKIRQLGD